MIEANWIFSLVGGLGTGAIITTIISHYISSSQEHRAYLRSKKEESYIGLLEAYSKAAVDSSVDARTNFVYWHMRVQIFGSKAVDNLVHEFYGPKGVSREAQKELRENIIAEIRKDLKVS